MADFMEAVSGARRRVDEASGRHARAVAQVEAAAEDAQRILNMLAEEFGVFSATEARALLKLFESQISEQIQIIETELSEAEGE